MARTDLTGHYETNETGGRRRLEDVAEVFKPEHSPRAVSQAEAEEQTRQASEALAPPQQEAALSSSEVVGQPSEPDGSQPEDEAAQGKAPGEEHSLTTSQQTQTQAAGHTRELLGDKTLPQLRQIAKDEGVGGVTTKSKSDLIDAILDED